MDPDDDDDRFLLAQDCQSIWDSATGRSYDVHAVARELFGKADDAGNTPSEDQMSAEPNYFTLLGQSVARRLADESFTAAHGSSMARDQEIDDMPAAQYNQEEAPISGEDCLNFVSLCLRRLSGSDREEFLEGLAQLISSETGATDGTLMIRHGANGNGSNGVRNNGRGSLDRAMRSGRRGAQDSAIQALNSKSFLRRFPEAGNIKFGGTGR